MEEGVRINRSLREEAARICSARAADWAVWDRRFLDGPPDHGMPMYSDNSDAIELATAAYREIAYRCSLDVSFTEEWAEADSLLRDGWTP